MIIVYVCMIAVGLMAAIWFISRFVKAMDVAISTKDLMGVPSLLLALLYLVMALMSIGCVMMGVAFSIIQMATWISGVL